MIDRSTSDHAVGDQRVAYQPLRSLESVPGRVWTAWRSPGRFTKNPDLVALPLLPNHHRTFFGTPPDSTGEVWWRQVTYDVRNPTEPDFHWTWSAAHSAFPDQYELDRVLELHANTHERADNGYSTWHRLADGEILVLDYTNQGDPYGQSHVVACRQREEDFETMGRRPALSATAVSSSAT